MLYNFFPEQMQWVKYDILIKVKHFINIEKIDNIK